MIRRLTYTLVSLTTSAILAGCIIPIPPMSVAGVRDNIGDRVPDFILPGVTTREDVLMQLGEADSFSGDQSELYYRTRIVRGGILAFMPAASGGAGYGYGRWLERMLTVEFDKNGLVTNVRVQTEACSEHFYGAGVRSGENRSCVPVDERTTAEKPPKTP